MDLTAVHDRMMANWPDGSTHDPANCQMCDSREGTASEDKPNGGAVVAGDAQYTQADLDAAIANAVAAAVAPLQSKLDEVAAAQADSDVESRVAAAVDPLNTQIAALQAQVDEAEVARQAEKDRADGIVAWLETEGSKAAEAAALEERKTTRAAQAKEVAGLTDEYLAKTPEGATASNLERFAAMTDEAWQATVDGWTAQREAAGLTETAGGPPKKTALTAAADRGGRKSAVSEAAEARIGRVVDLRSLSSKR